MQIKYITAALASLAVTSVSALPTVSDEAIEHAAIQQRSADLLAADIVPAIEQRSVDTDLVARAEQAQQNTQAAQAPQAQQAGQAKQGGQTVNSVTGQQCWGWSCYYRGRYVGVGVGVNVGGLGINVNGYVDPRYAYLYGGNYGVYPGAGYVNYGGYQNNGNIAIGNRVGGGIYQWA